MTADDKAKILNYRRKHQRCRYCKYHSYLHVPHWVKLSGAVPPECILTRKSIHPYFLGFNTLAGWKCEEFGVDEDRL